MTADRSNFGVCAGTTVEIAEHFGVGIELHLQLEMDVRKRNELKTFRQQRRLGHENIIIDKESRPSIPSPSR